ncbi:MAG: HlyC/CorC family transporter [Phycisphaerales bacterium]|nr:HlyC/CorC family transporter [Phycisphaerales bacterium]
MSLTTNAMWATLPALVGLSAIFSGSETVLFGLTADDRWRIQRDRPSIGKIVERLLAQPRGLLLTILLANTAVNTAFFAVATVVLESTELSMMSQVAVGMAEVAGLILLGEVFPKIIGNSMRVRLAPLIALPILALAWLMTPVRVLIERVIFVPLHRLAAPSRALAGPTAKELRDFVSAARLQGDISCEEEALLGRLLIMRRGRVRDVMTHRTEMVHALRRAPRSAIVALALKSRLKRLPIVDGTQDRIAGILDVRGYLLDARGVDVVIDAHLKPAVFVPEIASLEQLLELFRVQRCSIAIVVDEFGGTAGIVALEDAIEEIVGDIVAADEVEMIAPEPIDADSSRVDARMAASAFCAHYGLPLTLSRASTVGGIALEEFEAMPQVGQSFHFGALELRVERVENGNARSFIVRRIGRVDRELEAGESS